MTAATETNSPPAVWLDLFDASRHVRRTPSEIADAVVRGDLPADNANPRYPGDWRIREDDLEEWSRRRPW